MKPILIVDDDKLLLKGYALICQTEYPVETALNGAEALAKLETGGPYAVVLTDMIMPGMKGTELLAKVRERWPDTVRIMLTGNREQNTAVAALNEGNVFRFLNKPCPLASILQIVRDGVRQHELIVAERELLEKTLHGSLQILTEMLSLANPSQLVGSQKLRKLAATIARQLNWDNVWEIEIAAMLRQIGLMTIPPGIVLKSREGKSLSIAEQEMLMRIPEIGSTLLSRIPRLEGVAHMVLYQAKHFDGSGFPNNTVAGEAIPLGSRLIKILSDLIVLEATGASPDSVMKEIAERTGWYDPSLLVAMRPHFLAPSQEMAVHSPVSLKELRVGQTLAATVVTTDGVTLVSTGYVVTETLLERLQNFAVSIGIKEPIYVERTPR